METMYDRIVFLCKERGVTPTGLFRSIGISGSRLVDLKKGTTRSLARSNLEKVAKALNTTETYLCYGDDPNVFLVDVNDSKLNLTPLVQSLSTDDLFSLMNSVSDELKLRTKKKNKKRPGQPTGVFLSFLRQIKPLEKI